MSIIFQKPECGVLLDPSPPPETPVSPMLIGLAMHAAERLDERLSGDDLIIDFLEHARVAAYATIALGLGGPAWLFGLTDPLFNAGVREMRATADGDWGTPDPTAVEPEMRFAGALLVLTLLRPDICPPVTNALRRMSAEAASAPDPNVEEA